jgi:hypothetical protein
MTFVFREPYPRVSHWRRALWLQVVLLGVLLPLEVTLTGWPWLRWVLRSVCPLLIMTTVWTFFRFRDVRNDLNRRVELARQGLLSRGDMMSDPELQERLSRP